MIRALLNRYGEFAKYTLASGLSLLVDYVAYILLAQFSGMTLPAAAAAGYSIGLLFAYLLISQKVFSNGWLKERRKTEFTLFLVSGLLGIGLTYGTSALVVAFLGNMLNVAKLASVAVSFISVYLFRKFVVFPEKTDEPSIQFEKMIPKLCPKRTSQAGNTLTGAGRL